jgi:prepilin-type N-terminal cleavage/methylation domain-containing protein
LKTPQNGFTLAEIAVVLIVVALVLGGVLRGQEMISQAKVKHVVADISGVSAAMYSYHDRYRALPGDDKGSNRWALTPTATAGNGVIEGTYASTTAGEESRLFWHHLRLAGFVAGVGDEIPFNPLFGRTGVQTGDGAGGGVLSTDTSTQPIAGLVLCTANLPGKIAIAVDSHMDDGRGTTGSIRASIATYSDDAKKGKGKGRGNPTTSVKATADEYMGDGVSRYVVCRQMLL